MFSDLTLTQYVLIALPLYLVYTIYRRLTKPADALDILPWVRVSNSKFEKYLGRFNPQNSQDVIRKGFEQYNLNGLAFIFTPFLDNPKVILPPSQIQWLLDQPEEVVSFQLAVTESLSMQYSLLHPLVSEDPIHHDVVKTTLTRSLALTSPLVYDELREAFDLNWGQDSKNWVEHNVWKSMTKIFAQATARIFVGAPLCRNEKLLHLVVEFAELVITSGISIRGVPLLLRPLLGWIITRPNHRVFAQVKEIIGPIVDERKFHMMKAMEDPEYKWDEPFDLLQWLIARSLASNDPREHDTAQMVRRFCTICFAAIHTTALTSTNLLLDIISADPKHDALASLREEVLDVHRQSGGKWDKAALAKLVRIDSAIRESQRMHPAGTWSLQRKVVKPDGVQLPDGPIIPYGVDLAVAGYAVQRDINLYDEPDKFDPFRFSKSRTSLNTTAGSNDTQVDKSDGSYANRSTEILKDRNRSAVSTGLQHLPWGHGRHACPGRFFAIQEVKLMVVYALTNYEMKKWDTRPANPWFRDMMVPNQDATMSVKKIDLLA